MAGRYEYGSEPHDVYRRHDNCGCTVIYESGRQRQDVWTKKTWEVPEGAKKKYEPVRLSPERAKTLQQAKLSQYRGLTSGGRSGIIEESTKKPITQIDDKAIERVPVRSISGYTEEQCTEIQKQHRELLKYSKDKNDNKEVAFVFDRELGDRKEYVGTDDSVDFGNALYGKDLVVLHNHPRNGSFSFRDVVEFIVNGSIKTLTIVKNNGGVETLTKRHNYDTLAMLRELNRLEKNNVKTHSEKEYRKIIEKFLNKHHKGGILEWTK